MTVAQLDTISNRPKRGTIKLEVYLYEDDYEEAVKAIRSVGETSGIWATRVERP